MRARLIPVDDAPAIELVKDLTLIGRNEDCDVRLENTGVSKIHCLLVKTDGLVLVRDLGSTNGTRVNGQRVRRAALLPNDHLAIAGVRYQVKFGDDTASAGGTAGAVAPTVPPAVDCDSDELPSDPAISRGPVLQFNPLPDGYPAAPRG